MWALGCTGTLFALRHVTLNLVAVVIEMITGSPPLEHFGRARALYFVGSQMTAGHKIPQKFNASEELEDFLEKTMKIQPEQRWSPEELLQHPWISSWRLHGDEAALKCGDTNGQIGYNLLCRCWRSPTHKSWWSCMLKPSISQHLLGAYRFI